MKTSVLAVGCLFGVSVALAAAAPVTKQVELFDLTQVKLGDGPFNDAMNRDRDYLLSLDPSRFLLMFRITAGIPSTAMPFGGWESPGIELRGHSLGHYLSACSLMYSSTGDKKLKARVDEIVDALAECQTAAPKQGFHAGYVSAFPESFFDRVDERKEVWAPWYTMHKIMAGLLDAYTHTGNQKALDILNQLAGWVQFRVDRLTLQKMQASLETEHGGMNEALANLYAITGNPNHLRIAEAFNHQQIFSPLAHGEDRLNGLHANTQIPKIIGAAREYELTGNAEYKDVASFFWKDVALTRSYSLGGHSDDEHFFPINEFAKHLSPIAAETCNTYNMLKLTEHIFTWAPSNVSADFYERGLYNQILASQDPKKGMFAYFLSMKPGHFKTYSSPENSFWCCVGTGMENHAKYGEMIYAHGDHSIYVNLFIPSSLNWSQEGVTLQQETKFPEEQSTHLRLKLEHPAHFALKVRQPAWLASPLVVRVNDKDEAAVADKAGYVTVDRDWKNGDKVDVTLPMALRTETLPGSQSIVCVFYGPILLAGELGTENMPSKGAYALDQQDFKQWLDPAVPAFKNSPAQVIKDLKPVADQPLTYTSTAFTPAKEITWEPFYKLHHQRYSVYWNTTTEAGAL